MNKKAFINKSSSRSVSMRDIKSFSSGLYPALQACGVTRPMAHCTHGFTLIELLVVVLIIGILSAIALPQYQKAVMKSRYAQLKVLAKSLAQAEEIYHMSNGSYSKKLADLDIQLAGGTPDPEHEEQYNFPWGYCYVGIGANEKTANQACCNNTNIGMEYQQRLHFSSLSNQRICIAFNTDTSSLQNQICKAETASTTYSSQVPEAGYTSWRY